MPNSGSMASDPSAARVATRPCQTSQQACARDSYTACESTCLAVQLREFCCLVQHHARCCQAIAPASKALGAVFSNIAQVAAEQRPAGTFHEMRVRSARAINEGAAEEAY